MSNPLLRRLRVLDADITGTQHHVLQMLTEHANDQSYAWPSQATLAREGHRPRSTIKEAMKVLEAMGLIVRTGRVGKAVRYFIDLPPVEENRPPTGHVERNNQAACWPHGGGNGPPAGHMEPEGSGRPLATDRPPAGQGVAAHRPEPGRPPATEAQGSLTEAQVKPTPPPKATATAAAREVVEKVRASLGDEAKGKGWTEPHAYLIARLKAGATVAQAVLVAECKLDEWQGSRFVKNVRPSTLYAQKHWAEYLDQALDWDGRGRPAQGKAPRPPTKAPPEKLPAKWPEGHAFEMTDDWREVLAKIKPRLNDHVFSTYFTTLRGFTFLDGRRVLEAPNDFLAAWVRDNYQDFIQGEIAKAIGDDGAVVVHGPSREEG